MSEVIKKARSLGAKISPFSKISPDVLSVRTSPFNKCLPQSTLLSLTLENEGQIDDSYFSLYMIVLAIKETEEFGFQKDIVEYLINQTEIRFDLLKLPKENEEELQYLQYTIDALKFEIIKQALICEFLTKQMLSKEDLDSDTLKKIESAITKKMRNNNIYIRAYQRTYKKTASTITKKIRNNSNYLTTYRIANEVVKKQPVDILGDLLKELYALINPTNPSIKDEVDQVLNEVLNDLLNSNSRISSLDPKTISAELGLLDIEEEDEAEYIQDDHLITALLAAGISQYDIMEQYDKMLGSRDNSISLAILCYDKLSEAFIQTGNQELLERMKSNSYAAINEIYNAHPSWPENEKIEFSMLVNSLNKAAAHDSDRFVENVWRPEDNEASKFKVKEYNLSEVLNFTLNYIVYGIGIGWTPRDILRPYESENPAKNDNPLNKFINRLFRLIALYHSNLNAIGQITEAINNCVAKKDIVTKGVPMERTYLLEGEEVKKLYTEDTVNSDKQLEKPALKKDEVTINTTDDHARIAGRKIARDDILTKFLRLLMKNMYIEDITKQYEEMLKRSDNSISLAILCYDKLSEAFIQTGNQELLERMKSNSYAAINKIYNSHPSWPENDKIEFSELVNSLNNATAHDSDRFVENVWRPEDNEASKFKVKEYNLSEILNFTLNYLVYGTTGWTPRDILGPYESENPAKNDNPLNKFINRLFRLIALRNRINNLFNYPKLCNTAVAIIRCLDRKELIESSNPIKYITCNDYLFKIDGGEIKKLYNDDIET